jgi:hypothetical protein
MNNLDTPNFQAPTQKPIWNTVLRFGGIYGGSAIALSLLLYLMEVNTMSIGNMMLILVLSLAMAITINLFAIKHQRDQLDGGFISFGKATGIGVLVTMIGSVASTIWNWILINFIDPEYINKMKDQFIETWGENMSTDQLEQAVQGFDKAGDLGGNLVNGLIVGAIVGVIAGLILAAFLKREQPIFRT